MPNREKISILPPLDLESMEMRTGNSYMAGKLKRVRNRLHFTIHWQRTMMMRRNGTLISFHPSTMAAIFSLLT